MENNPYIYQLSEKLEYSKDGDFKTTAELQLTGPSMAVFDLASDLSQEVMRAFMSAADLKEVLKDTERPQSLDTSDGIDAGALKMILFQSKSVKFKKIAKICKELFTRVGTYDGSTRIKLAVLERLEINDFIELVCGYIANFIIPSLFKTEGD